MFFSIISGAFNGADSLYSVYLDGNAITTLQENTFADLSNLFYITLDNNPIGILEAGKIS